MMMVKTDYVFFSTSLTPAIGFVFSYVFAAILCIPFFIGFVSSAWRASDSCISGFAFFAPRLEPVFSIWMFGETIQSFWRIAFRTFFHLFVFDNLSTVSFQKCG
jgi:hypothetical protein